MKFRLFPKMGGISTFAPADMEEWFLPFFRKDY
jgi:hypothetical protein